MTTALYWIMLISLGLMFWLAYEHRMHGKKSTKIAAVVVSMIALSCAIATLMMNFWGSSFQYEEFRRKEARYQYIANKRFGQEIARLHPGSKALIVDFETYSQAPAELKQEIDPELDVSAAEAKGFAEGIGNSIDVVHRQEVRIEDEMYYEMDGGPRRSKNPQFSSKLLNALIKKYKECDIFILMTGLPFNHEKEFDLWRIEDPKNRPTLILKHMPSSPMKKAIERGFVSIILAEVPRNINLQEPLPESEEEIFKKRYALITKETLPAVMQSAPKLFQK